MRALFTTLPGLGHLHQMVPLARALQRAGHAIAFATSGPFRATVEASGFECSACGLDWLEAEFAESFPLLRTVPPGSQESQVMVMELLSGVVAERMIPDLQKLILDWHADLVVRDLLEYAGCVAAESLGVPHASCGPLFYPDPDHVNRTVGGALTTLRESLGLPRDATHAMLFRYLDLAFVPASYLGGERAVSPVTHFIRPEIFDQSGPERLPEWMGALPARRRIVATLGTVFNSWPGLFETIVDALGDGPFDVILTVGRNRDPLTLGRLPDNVHVVRYVPYTLLLPECDLVIAHGGSTTMLSCLAHGLPLVLIPLAGEHFSNADRCVRAAVGVSLGPHQRTAREIRRAAFRVLSDPAYRENAWRLREEMSELPGPERAVELLESLASAKVPQPRVPPALDCGPAKTGSHTRN